MHAGSIVSDVTVLAFWIFARVWLLLFVVALLSAVKAAARNACRLKHGHMHAHKNTDKYARTHTSTHTYAHAHSHRLAKQTQKKPEGTNACTCVCKPQVSASMAVRKELVATASDDLTVRACVCVWFACVIE